MTYRESIFYDRIPFLKVYQNNLMTSRNISFKDDTFYYITLN